MATAYTEFDCLGTDLLATIQTAILASTDWARPNSGTYPHLYKATTTRGAQMAVDLNAVALTVNTMTLDFYHSHDGTTGVGAARRYLRTKGTATGTLATNTYHVVVSAGKEHLFIQVEGPRGPEPNADHATYGSTAGYLFINDLVPYFPGTDATETVIQGAPVQNTTVQSLTSLAHVAYAARDGLDAVYNSPGRLATLHYITTASAEVAVWSNRAVLDSDNFYLGPYVFFDFAQGIRGRLASFFFAGYTRPSGSPDPTPLPPVGQVVDYGGVLYKLIPCGKGDSNNYSQHGAFGFVTGANSSLFLHVPVVAVPYA